VVKADKWAFKTVAHPDDALDGKWCGLVVASASGQFVIDQYSTAVVLWDWAIAEASDLDRGGDLMPADIADVKRCDHSNMLSDIQKASANPGTSVKLNPLSLLFQGEEAFINIAGGNDVPFGCHLLLPLTTPDAFDRQWPGHIAGRGKGKAANWVGLYVQAAPRNYSNDTAPAKLEVMRICGLESGILIRIKAAKASERIQEIPTPEVPKGMRDVTDSVDHDEDPIEYEETHIADKPTAKRGRAKKAVKFGKAKR
jgi:hypothetical protein